MKRSWWVVCESVDEIEVSVGITVTLSREEEPSAADEEWLSLGTGESSISPCDTKLTVMGENGSW